MCDHAEDLDDGELSSNGCYKACELQRGCNFPRIRPLNEFDDGLSFFPGEDCSETIAEYINPYHDASCAVYGIISGLLAYIAFLWAFMAFQDSKAPQARQSVHYRLRIHSFICMACVINLFLSFDLKAYANRYPLVMTEFFSDLAFSFMCCMLFHMITLWVDAISLGGRTLWARRNKTIMPVICVIVTASRVSLGLAQWLAEESGEKKYVGNINVAKLLSTALAVFGYSAVGLYASIYAQVETATAAVEGDKKSIAKIRVLHQKYLLGLLLAVGLFLGYVIYQSRERVGNTERRDVPCSLSEKTVYTNQLTVISLAAVFIVLSWSGERNRGFTWYPQSEETRRAHMVASPPSPIFIPCLLHTKGTFV